jgi:hypothetical protein
VQELYKTKVVVPVTKGAAETSADVQTGIAPVGQTEAVVKELLKPVTAKPDDITPKP